MPNHDPIEQEIVDSLKAFYPVAVSKRYTNADWTKGIKAVFSAIGHKNQYTTYFSNGAGRLFNDIQKDVSQTLGGLLVPTGSHRPNEFCEWLYDIVWWRQDNQGHVIDIPLVAESEWGDFNAVKDDFQKLLLARSKYRVMIFEYNNKNQNNCVINWCKDQINKFKYTQKGDRYLFCFYQGNEFGFYCETYVAS